MDQVGVVSFDVYYVAGFADLSEVGKCRHGKRRQAHFVQPVMHGLANVVVPECVAEDAGEDFAFVAGASLVAWQESC